MPYNAFICPEPAQLIPLQTPPPLQVLLDIGAGMGMFSLAAAARGHKAYAFELSPKSLASLEASIEFNGFQHLITVHKVGPLAAMGCSCSAQVPIRLACVLLWHAPACRQWSSIAVCVCRGI